jgi:crotonobetainyl-CoA:carnitine CoA-transferase CaiB-like acyl-CoA transferase
VVNLTAYGTAGPWAERPGSGTLAEAMSGLAALTGPPDAPPTLSPVGLGDYLGVLEGMVAALLGLYARGARRDPASRGGLRRDVRAVARPTVAAARDHGDGVQPGAAWQPRSTCRTADGGWSRSPPVPTRSRTARSR